jgi:hypothetical protein
MDIVQVWAEKIAQEIVPDEIDSVPFVAADFVKGGKARKALLQRSKGGILGGFGAEATVLLPWILHAISEAAPFLAGLLASRSISNTFAIVKAVRATLGTRKHKLRGLVPAEQADPSFELAMKCMDVMVKALKASGLSSSKSEKVANEVISTLLQDVPGAMELVQKLTEIK